MNGLAGVLEQDCCGVEERVSQDLTFRDPAGQLLLTPTHALRRINPAAVKETRAFLESSLRLRLELSGALIESEIADASLQPGSRTGELWLQHRRIDPISYPWEWTTAQWQAAAEVTLRVADAAIDAGWTLKDATPLNIVFDGARPVLVDVLSLERRDPQSSVWLAYGQFVRTFLLPLVAAKYLCWPLQDTFFSRDGYEPELIYRALKPWQRVSPDLLDVVTLAALFEGKSGKQGKASGGAKRTDPELATHILHKRIARLRKQIRRMVSGEKQSSWSRYVQTASHYGTADVEDKLQFVQAALDHCGPREVLDIGANTGTYSLMAAEAGARVVALDSDSGAMEALWRTALEKSKPIACLLTNIARPTPAAGWRNREQLSLLDRLTGKFEMVLMLAVIHHLILREQVPLGHIADLAVSLTRKWLILEWVPPSDPMYQEWLRGREELYGSLSESDLMDGFGPYFRLCERKALGNGRVLMLLERHDLGRQVE